MKDIHLQDAPMIISHRVKGFGFTENSISGLRAALEAKVPEVEMDFRLSKDHKFVCMHDPYLGRTCNGKGYIHDYYADDLRKFRLKRCSFGFIPSMEDVLKVFVPYKKSTRLNIDVKDYGQEKELLRLIRKYGCEKEATIVTWLPEILQRVKEIAPKIQTSLYFVPFFKNAQKWSMCNRRVYTIGKNVFYVNQFGKFEEQHRRKFCYHVLSHPPINEYIDMMSIHWFFLSKRMMDECRSIGKPVRAISVNKRWMYERIKHLNPDAVYTTDIGIFRK